MKKTLLGVSLVLLFSALYIYLWQSGALEDILQLQSLQENLQRLGVWGPLLIVTLMAAAIVMSPIPSAPIAITSGLMYGHTWGTIYILVGAEIGALIAFSIARLLGYDAMQKRFGDQLKYKFLNSSNHVMVVIFITRLIPFISFDIISYAAGLTRIRYWQFAIATLAGILPASFLLAHFGGEMASDDIKQMMMTILLLGSVTLVPIIFSLVKRYR